MEETRIINIPGMGAVRMRKSRRATRFSISVTNSGDVRITIPRRGTIGQAKSILHEKSDWVAKHREKACRLRLCHEALVVHCNPVSREEATVILLERFDHLARKYGFSFNSVSIRNQKTRWGSCSARNNISLNEKLARLPRRLTDYVLLHELVHTRVRNHGEDFRRELGKYVEDVRGLRRELREYRLGLF